MADKMDKIDLWLNDGIDLKNRRISFGVLDNSEVDSGIEWRSIELAIRAIQLLELESPNKPIEIHMSSPGGDPHEMLRLIDVIESSNCQFKFIGSGCIASSAVWIMACCDERYLHKNTYIGVHDSSGEPVQASGKITDARIAIDVEYRLQFKLNNMLADNSRMPLEFWEEMVKRDLWLTADEAVMLGLAEKIIEPKKRGNLRRMRISHLKKEVDKQEMTKLVMELNDRIYSKKITKLQLHTPKEHFDNKVFVDSSPSIDEAIGEHDKIDVEQSNT